MLVHTREGDRPACIIYVQSFYGWSPTLALLYCIPKRLLSGFLQPKTCVRRFFAFLHTKYKSTRYPMANTLSIQWLTYYPITDAWVTRPERPKGAKDEVKRPEGPPARSGGPEGP